ncbi:SDR family oxidoreductase [soil metagenome]
MSRPNASRSTNGSAPSCVAADTYPAKNTRRAIVTGASAGIGLAIARRLAAAGFGVVVNARRAERLDEVVRELGSARATAAPGDCAEQPVIDAMLAAAHTRFGGTPDCVVINAGRGLAGSVLTSDTAQWEEMVRTNLLGAARLLRSAAEAMLAQVAPEELGQHGAWTRTPRDIIVIGSVVGRHVSPFSSMYGATKFGVHGLVEGARRELAPKGIRVSLVEPGFVVSEFQGVAGYKTDWFEGIKEKIAPMLEPDDVARVVEFIAMQPAHVHVGDVLVRPTRQEYP